MPDRLSLLIVDDRAENLLLIKALIGEFFSNVDVYQATSSEDGLKIAARENIDCALIDVQMPRTDGIEMCRRLKANEATKNISINLITSHKTTPELRAEGLSSGADDFILRPFEINEFVARLKVLFRVKQAEGDLRALNDHLEELVEERTDKLRKSEQKYHSYVDNAPDGIFVFDNSGKFVDVNPMACAMTGYSKPELTSMSIQDLFHPEDLEECFVCIEHIIQTGQSYRESRYIAKNGQVLHWALNAVKLDELHFLGFAKDITSRILQEEEKETLEEQLRQSQKMEAIGRLAGGVAHDFNNLLTAISGFSELVYFALAERDPLREDVNEIRKAADSAASLTQQLLAFSRKQIISPRVLNLNHRIAESENMLRRLIGEDIELQVIPDLNLGRVIFDSGQVDQILLNLAVNSRDAMPHGGKLIIETKNIFIENSKCLTCAENIAGDFVMIAITDTGHGMDKHEINRIFEPFYTTKKKNAGTGLGLSTIHGIVHQNLGHIKVDSEPGRGTTVKIFIPVVAEIETEHTSQIQDQNVRGEETILLVEDQDLVRRLAKRILADSGYKVIEAEDGSAALKKYAECEGRIDLLLTDVVMPQMSGKQLYDRLAKIDPLLKVLFMSGYTEDTIAHHGVLDEGTNFIHKPFHKTDMLIKIREIIDSQPPENDERHINHSS